MANEKVAIVTAGGSGMGAAAARKLASDGFRVAILSSSGKGEALANELGGLGVTGSNQSMRYGVRHFLIEAIARGQSFDRKVPDSVPHGRRRICGGAGRGLPRRATHQILSLRPHFQRRFAALEKWSEREDLNLRPPQPHCGALPGCATLRPVPLSAQGRGQKD